MIYLILVIAVLLVYSVVVTWAAISNRNQMEYWMGEHDRYVDGFNQLYKFTDEYMDADIERRLGKIELEKKFKQQKGMDIVVD